MADQTTTTTTQCKHCQAILEKVQTLTLLRLAQHVNAITPTHVNGDHKNYLSPQGAQWWVDTAHTTRHTLATGAAVRMTKGGSTINVDFTYNWG